MADTRHLSRAQIMKAIVMKSLILLMLRKTEERRKTMKREKKAATAPIRKKAVLMRKNVTQLLKNRKALHLGVVPQMKKMRWKRAMHLKVALASASM